MDENQCEPPPRYRPICRVGIALGSLWVLGLAHVFTFMALGIFHPAIHDKADEMGFKIFCWWLAAQTIIAISVVAVSLRCILKARRR
jgi:hypothetical protein